MTTASKAARLQRRRRSHTLRERASRIQRLGFLWGGFGVLILIPSIVTPSLMGGLLGIAWIGMGWAVSVLAKAAEELDPRNAALEIKLAGLLEEQRIAG
ncbi:MAG: hypothetical protein AAFZ65_01160 [Planctomycetota bacterium]